MNGIGIDWFFTARILIHCFPLFVIRWTYVLLELWFINWIGDLSAYELFSFFSLLARKNCKHVIEIIWIWTLHYFLLFPSILSWKDDYDSEACIQGRLVVSPDIVASYSWCCVWSVHNRGNENNSIGLVQRVWSDGNVAQPMC